MTPGRLPLSLYRGDTYRWRFRLWLDTSETVPADLTGATARSEIRDKPGGTLIVTIACSISLPNIIDAVLSAADCAKLPGSGAWDLQLTYASGDVATVLAGAVNTVSDVTSVVPPPALVRAAR